jgi:hypothetical protein
MSKADHSTTPIRSRRAVLAGAVSVARTAPEFPNEEFKERLAQAFRDMEGQICDLDRMSEIADRLTGGWLEESGASPPREAELAVCAVEQVSKAMKEFRENYYRAYEGARSCGL